MATKDPSLIKGEDLLINGVYKQVTLTIKSAVMAERDNEGGKQEGLLLSFEKAQKPFFAPKDKTNWKIIKCELGTLDPTKMIGKQLTLIPVIGNWFGLVNSLALRVVITGGKPSPQVTAKAFGKSVAGLVVMEVPAETPA